MRSSSSVLSSLALVGLILAESSAFAPQSTATIPSTTALSARRRNWRNEEPDEPRSEIPQLPPTTSFNPNASPSLIESDTAFVDRKFTLQYTCKKCETRNTHKVSRIAYNKGVVICVCKGCMAQHLISDHLGFTNLQMDGNLEDYFENDEVKRVNEDVFQLERILGLDSKGGSIFGPNGETAME